MREKFANKLCVHSEANRLLRCINNGKRHVSKLFIWAIPSVRSVYIPVNVNFRYFAFVHKILISTPLFVLLPLLLFEFQMEFTWIFQTFNRQNAFTSPIWPCALIIHGKTVTAIEKGDNENWKNRVLTWTTVDNSISSQNRFDPQKKSRIEINELDEIEDVLTLRRLDGMLIVCNNVFGYRSNAVNLRLQSEIWWWQDAIIVGYLANKHRDIRWKNILMLRKWYVIVCECLNKHEAVEIFQWQ